MPSVKLDRPQRSERAAHDDIRSINRGFRRVDLFATCATGRGTDPLVPIYAVHGRVVADSVSCTGQVVSQMPPPRRDYDGRPADVDFSIRTSDILGAAADSACAAVLVGGIAADARRDWSVTNSLVGIDGAHAGSARLLGLRPRLKHVTDPNERDYALPGGHRRADDAVRDPIGRSRSAASLAGRAAIILHGGRGAGIEAVWADTRRAESRVAKVSVAGPDSGRAGVPGWASLSSVLRHVTAREEEIPREEKHWRALCRATHVPAAGTTSHQLFASALLKEEAMTRTGWQHVRNTPRLSSASAVHPTCPVTIVAADAGLLLRTGASTDYGISLNASKFTCVPNASSLVRSVKHRRCLPSRSSESMTTDARVHAASDIRDVALLPVA